MCSDCGAEIDTTQRFSRCPACREKRCTYMKQWYRQASGGIVSKDCEHCGDSYSGIARGMARRKFCSRKCKVDAKNAKTRAALAASKQNLVRDCPQCGSTLDRAMRSDAVYCSETCNSAAHNATRKVKMKILVDGAVERIPRAYIIERDASRCHMCRKKCKPNEIQLDHVIPISVGGTHTLENIRVACATCNLSKGARVRYEQLMLIG